MIEVSTQQFTGSAKAYVQAGRSIIPLNNLVEKKPAIRWSENQRTAATRDDVIRWFAGGRYPGMAVVTGKISGNLQCFDHDCKNDDGVAHAAWCAEVERRLPGLLARLVSEKSQSGGTHYYFCCDEIAGGVTLATTEPRIGDDGKLRPKPLIETKENGRYVACFPTPGYEPIHGRLTEVPSMSSAERRVLHEAARMQHKNVARDNPGYRHESNPNTPGNLYTAQATMDDVEAMVVEAGWTALDPKGGDVRLYERPGKDEASNGANLTMIDGTPLFYVYTSSVEHFTPMKAVNAFTVRTFLKHGGNFKACAAELRTLGFDAEEKEEKVKKPDAGDIGEEVGNLIQNEWSFDHTLGQWREWNGKFWEAHPVDPPKVLLRAMQSCIRGFGQARVNSYRQVMDNLALTKAEVARVFTRREDVINFTNGTLHLQGGKESRFSPHQQADNLISTVGYEYQPDEDFPSIRAFLRETIPDEAARLAYAAHLGLALRSDSTLHKALVLIGGKNSGKSTAFQLANLVCGNTRVSGPGGQLFSEEQEGLRARATWHDKLLVAIDEMPSDALRYENVTKAMLAHSSVPMRHLHQREIEKNAWRPKVLFTCNEEPRFTDRTATVKRRLLYIQCPNAREDSDPTINRRLIHVLREEVGSFVKFCLDQADEVLLNSGYPESSAMLQYADRVEIESDSLKSFVHYHCVFDPDGFVPSAALWSDYSSYCSLNGHKGVLAQTGMVRSITQRYGAAKGVTNAQRRVTGGKNAVRGLQGIRLRTSEDGDSEDLYTL
jgi:phage/plasmid-associated DNA primase